MYNKVIEVLCNFSSADSSKKVFISQIKEVPYGHHTEIFINLKNNGGHLAAKKNPLKTKILDIHEKKCFSIIYKNHSLPIDLVAEDIESADKWVRKSIFTVTFCNLLF